MGLIVPPPPRPDRAPIAQGWGVLSFSRTSHWVRYDGTTLCRRYLRADMRGYPEPELTAAPVDYARKCVVCQKLLDEMRAKVTAAYRRLNPGTPDDKPTTPKPGRSSHV